MKLVIRTLVLGICAVGASAMLAAPHPAKAVLGTAHATTSSAMPIPNCNPSGCN